jgi:hypothetical protein
MGCSNDVQEMFVCSFSWWNIRASNAVLQSASLPAIAYDAYFMSKRYAIVSEKGITVLDPDE